MRNIWRLLIIGALVANVFEGAIRKWVIPEWGEYVYFLKDSLLVLAYLVYFAGERNKAQSRFPKVLLGWFILASVIILLQIVNQTLGSVIAGIFGAKTYLLYAVLLFVVPDLFRTRAGFVRFSRLYLILAIPVCLLGAAQFEAPANSPINRYAIGEEDIATFGESASARVTGTFAYVSGHTAFLEVMAVLALGIMVVDRATWMRIVALGTLILTIANMLMSGSRAPVLIVAGLFALTFVWFAFRTSALASRLWFSLGVAGIGAFMVITSHYMEAFDAFKYRLETSDEEFFDRAFQHHDEIFILADYIGLWGIGPGVTHPGTAALRKALNLPEPTVMVPEFEAEYARAIIELGVIGCFIWYGFRAVVLFQIISIYRKLRAPELRFWAFLIGALHLLTLTAPVVLNHTYGLYYWFLAGLVLGLPKLDIPPEPENPHHRAILEIALQPA